MAEPSAKLEKGLCDALRESQMHESSDKRDVGCFWLEQQFLTLASKWNLLGNLN